jgi:hypothetical protein
VLEDIRVTELREMSTWKWWSDIDQDVDLIKLPEANPGLDA